MSSAPVQDEAAPLPPPPALMPLLGWAAIAGILASLGAVAFVSTEHHLQALLWEDLPDRFGWEEPVAWWVYAVLMTGAVLTWLALRLPGNGGHQPLAGFSFDLGPAAVASVVLAALASLAFGAVLGPEAPLIAIGTAVAAAVYRRDDPQSGAIIMAAGGVAAIGLILGNPLVVAILLLEGLLLKGSRGGAAAMTQVLPALVALGFGYLLQVGIGDWGGFGESVLAVPGLTLYDNVVLLDLLVIIPMAGIVAILGVLAVSIGHRVEHLAARNQLLTLVVAAVVVATLAVAAARVTGQSLDTVLFSGQSAIPEVLTITSIGTLLIIAMAKVIAYGACLGAGFRGGQIFPAIFIGVVLGTATSLMFGGEGLAAYVAGGIAAGSAAVVRLPFTSVLLAVLLCAGAGLAVTSPAIVGAVVGLLVRLIADRRAADVSSGPAAQPIPA